MDFNILIRKKSIKTTYMELQYKVLNFKSTEGIYNWKNILIQVKWLESLFSLY